MLKNLKNQGINFLIRLCLHKKNSNFIFFKTLRINDTNNLYDPILEAPYDALKNTKTSFNLSSDPNFFNFLAPLFSSSFPLSMPRVIYSIKNPKIDELTQKISIAVNKYFGINVDQDYEEIILDSVIKYLSDLNFWEKVFRDYKPSSIFLCDNGAFKGLYQSAGKFKIKVYEFQHGEIGDRNIRYFYPASIEPNVHCNLPHSLLTFSDYWSNAINYPVNRIIPVGNNSFCLHRSNFYKSNQGLMVVSTKIHRETLIHFVEKLSPKIGQKKMIYYKLHPEEFIDQLAIKSRFNKFKNVQVVSDNLSLQELINLCPNVMGINSTLINICLNAGCNIYLYKKGFYSGHKDIMDYVEAFDDLENFLELYEKNSKKLFNKQPIFFEKFNQEIFLNMVNERND